MLGRYTTISLIVLSATLLAAGCNLIGPNRNFDSELAHYKQVAKTVEHPELNTPPSDNAFTPEPRTLDHHAAPQQHEWWDLSLDEAIQMAVSRSSVLRDLGGTVVRAPETVRTILEPSKVSSDARFGMEAALSEFDATLASSVTAEKNDRMINNFVASGGTRFFRQDLINFQSQISKVAATGTRMTLRGISIYDFNNASFNRFPSVWDSLVEAEFRQPLWQGAGARFNRLAGPNSVPGFYNGVLIARVNTDISVADFEMGLRDLVSNVENAYWDLYFAFRDLDAKIQLRNASLDAWKRIKVLVESDQASGQIEREAQAREQYFRYEEEVQNALAGTLQQSTTNNNGSSGGSFRGVGGVLVSERRLRLAMGLPITDNRMIRPADEPTLAKVGFDWMEISDDAIARRPELLKQRLLVKRREMEYVAARNFLLPRFDVVGRYRFRGLGRDLIGTQEGLPPDPTDPQGYFALGSLANLANGNFQEWQLGGEVTMPVGFRRGWAAVRNAQLNLARDKAVLEEQERQVMHDLSNALGDMQRAYQIMETSYNRRLAAQQNVEILQFRLQSSQPISAEQVLEGQRRLTEADIMYHRALVEHILAIKNVHFEKGTLLEYGHIQLAEQFAMERGSPTRRTREPSEPTPAMLPEGMPPVESLPPAIDSTLPMPLAPPAPEPMPAPAFIPQAPPPVESEPILPPPPPLPVRQPDLSLPPPSLPSQSILSPTSTRSTFSSLPVGGKASMPTSVVPETPAVAIPTAYPATNSPGFTQALATPPPQPGKPLLEWKMSTSPAPATLEPITPAIPLNYPVTLQQANLSPPVETRASFSSPPSQMGTRSFDIPQNRGGMPAENRDVQRTWYSGGFASERPAQAAWVDKPQSMPAPLPALPVAKPSDYWPAPDGLQHLPQPAATERLPLPPAAN
jgi:outer membrane protein TolC